MPASLPLSAHAAYRRNELQAMYVKFETEIEELNQRVEQQARERSGARLLMNSSWSRTNHRVSDRSVPRRSGAIRRQQRTAQLCRDDPRRILYVDSSFRGEPYTKPPLNRGDTELHVQQESSNVSIAASTLPMQAERPISHGSAARTYAEIESWAMDLRIVIFVCR
ncbi:MAG: hypothetical protein QOG55_1275 [Acidobacteriaceae bacterium]|jgi:hypothetical protein|nr:hypothetical protein [Acidobacteriaceae bacterium]